MVYGTHYIDKGSGGGANAGKSIVDLRSLGIDSRADAVREACCQAYARLSTDDLSGHVIPGVADLLEWLSARDDVRLALLTGNYEAVARLNQYWAEGA